MALLVVGVAGLIHFDGGDVSADTIIEIVFFILLTGGMLGAAALAIPYALAQYLKRNPKT